MHIVQGICDPEEALQIAIKHVVGCSGSGRSAKVSGVYDLRRRRNVMRQPVTYDYSAAKVFKDDVTVASRMWWCMRLPGKAAEEERTCFEIDGLTAVRHQHAFNGREMA
jgi:hypothetical protein